MLQGLNLPPQFAVALDPEFIRATVARATSLKLPRRTCRPLESRPSRHLELDDSAFDSEIDEDALCDDEQLAGAPDAA